jgi:hypothetical protein
MTFCRLVVYCLTIASLAAPAFAQDPDDWLRLHAVHINRTPQQAWTGYGVYMGNGLVITAAHVIGWAFWTKPRVEVAGKNHPTKVVKEGWLSGADVAVVSVDQGGLPENLRPLHMRLCPIDPFPGEQVLVVTPEGIARSHVMAPNLLPRDVPSRFHTVISDVATTGNSGSGVFDVEDKCLLGIISRRIFQTQTIQENGKVIKENYDIAKYFVPSSVIADFMPTGLHF